MRIAGEFVRRSTRTFYNLEVDETKSRSLENLKKMNRVQRRDVCENEGMCEMKCHTRMDERGREVWVDGVVVGERGE